MLLAIPVHLPGFIFFKTTYHEKLSIIAACFMSLIFAACSGGGQKKK